MARTGPVVMSVAGDEFVDPARILLIIWEGTTTSGNTVEVVSRGTPQDIIWPGRTDSSETYLGANFGPTGLHAPDGFKLAQISAGRVLIYLKEN